MKPVVIWIPIGNEAAIKTLSFFSSLRYKFVCEVLFLVQLKMLKHTHYWKPITFGHHFRKYA